MKSNNWTRSYLWEPFQTFLRGGKWGRREYLFLLLSGTAVTAVFFAVIFLVIFFSGEKPARPPDYTGLLVVLPLLIVFGAFFVWLFITVTSYVLDLIRELTELLGLRYLARHVWLTLALALALIAVAWLVAKRLG